MCLSPKNSHFAQKKGGAVTLSVEGQDGNS